MKITIRELQSGKYFTLKQVEAPEQAQVFVRGEYDRSEKKYSCRKFGDVNEEIFFKGNKEVYTAFIF